ncbi:MAG: aspartate/glutamate racemase family protein [Desulfovibrionales bacterium]
MKCIGVIGGMNWECTQEYYSIVNRGVQAKLGGMASAFCLVYSFNYQEIANFRSMGAWHSAGLRMAMAAASLERAGAELLVIADSSMHRVAEMVQSAVRIPLVHVGDAMAMHLKERRFGRVALLGSTLDEQEAIFCEPCRKSGVEILDVDSETREQLRRILFGEACAEERLEQARLEFGTLVESLVRRGAQALVVSSYELHKILDRNQIHVPVLLTTAMHADTAVEAAFS